MEWLITMTYLAGCTVMDIRKRELNIIYCIIFAAIGIIYILCSGEMGNIDVYVAVIPGVLMIALGFVFKENIGLGDGIMLVTVAMFLKFAEIMALLFWSMIFIVVVYYCKIMFCNKNKKKELKSVPAAPYYLMGEVVVFAYLL